MHFLTHAETTEDPTKARLMTLDSNNIIVDIIEFNAKDVHFGNILDLSRDTIKQNLDKLATFGVSSGHGKDEIDADDHAAYLELSWESKL